MSEQIAETHLYAIRIRGMHGPYWYDREGLVWTTDVRGLAIAQMENLRRESINLEFEIVDLTEVKR